MAQRIGINPVLQSDAGNHRRVAGSVVDRCPALLGSKKDFSQSAVLIMADAGDVAKAAGLDIQERMGTTIQAVDRGLPWGSGHSLAAPSSIRPSSRALASALTIAAAKRGRCLISAAKPLPGFSLPSSPGTRCDVGKVAALVGRQADADRTCPVVFPPLRQRDGLRQRLVTSRHQTALPKSSRLSPTGPKAGLLFLR